MSRLNWTKLKHTGNKMERAIEPKKQPVRGGWTHVKSQPVKTYTPEEIAAFMEGRQA